MSIQITNDPINQFLDNLPRYALELRRQDQQRDQFNRQMELREQAAKNQQTLFDLTRNKQKFQSDVLKEQYNYQQDVRNATKEWESWTKDNQQKIDNWNARRNIPVLGRFSAGKYEDAMKRRENEIKGLISAAKLAGGNTSFLESKLNETKKEIERYKNLPNLSNFKPKEIPIPEGLEFDKSLFGFATQENLQPTIQQEINKYFTMLGGSQMGRVDSMFKLQDIEARSAR